MRKRVDHDATQEVSSSQLVPPAKPPVLGNVPKNDASMWLSAPVSADDFVGVPKQKPAGSRGRGLVIGATVIGLLGVGGAGAYYAFLHESPTQSSTVAPPTTPAPVAAPVSIDAAVAVEAPADAAVVVEDAAVPATAAALQADAVSAADPAVKKQKRPTKKKVVKKKTATKRR